MSSAFVNLGGAIVFLFVFYNMIIKKKCSILNAVISSFVSLNPIEKIRNIKQS